MQIKHSVSRVNVIKCVYRLEHFHEPRIHQLSIYPILREIDTEFIYIFIVEQQYGLSKIFRMLSQTLNWRLNESPLFRDNWPSSIGW